MAGLCMTFVKKNAQKTLWWLSDYCLCNDCLTFDWWLFDDCLMTTWWLNDYCVRTALQLCTWLLPDDFLMIACDCLTKYLTKILPYDAINSYMKPKQNKTPCFQLSSKDQNWVIILQEPANSRVLDFHPCKEVTNKSYIVT